MKWEKQSKSQFMTDSKKRKKSEEITFELKIDRQYSENDINQKSIKLEILDVEEKK